MGIRKTIIAFLALCILWTTMSVAVDFKDAGQQSIVIPKDAIRLRILANSNDPYDQAVKYRVRDEVKGMIDTWVKDLTSFDAAKQTIAAREAQLRQAVERVLKKANYKGGYTLALKKAQFPMKMYGQFLYEAGEYDALVITLGQGDGANWWCVLFPPLCFADFASGTVTEEVKAAPIEGEEEPKIEARSWFAEVFDAIVSFFTGEETTEK
ncbi:MAG: stage II sporulation protein R [Bacilli bacterium]